MKEKKEAILFDLDGTLWDSSREVLLCWDRVLSPLGRSITAEELSRLMGLTPREIGDAQFPDLPPAERYALTDRCLAADRKSTRLNSSHPTTSRMPSSA